MELKQNICVYIEIAGGALSPLSIELLGKARQLADAKGKQVVAFVAGADTAKVSQEAISYGADAVVAVEDSALAAYDSVLYTKAIAALAEKYEPSVILIGGSPDGRDLGGRLSAQLGVGLVADCTDVRFEGDDDTLTWIRPAYTGKLFVKIQTTTRPQLATISDKIFHGTPADPVRKGEIIKESVDFAGAAPSVKVTNFEPVEKEAEELTITTADIVVGAGRGVQTEDGMKAVQAFAQRIGAAFGVSKPLVDKEWAPYEWQIGITGKKIAPKIYIALGISGAIQHKLGIQDAGLIIAVNKDPDAPIFKFAHYGIVGDLFEVMPELEKQIKKIRG
ncbi:electron transfer flavoprotein subunit alpha/FixB family protein [Megasphaera sp.]|uniref:electron transfer flavoprotein subunit alpha/FixB family protein n=1 Tax=Megasphaera sp. TaxID=2023260 RepID=UPI00307F712A